MPEGVALLTQEMFVMLFLFITDFLIWRILWLYSLSFSCSFNLNAVFRSWIPSFKLNAVAGHI